jgi:hypothetical protein
LAATLAASTARWGATTRSPIAPRSRVR